LISASSGSSTSGGTTGSGSSGGGLSSGGSGGGSDSGSSSGINGNNAGGISSGGLSCASGLQTTSLTRNLYKGIKGGDVKTLQTFLVNQKYLTADSITGFFGPLTEKAIQAFQKSQNIISSGSPLSTGYGNVGPMTRTKINSMFSSCVAGTPTATTQSLQEQIKILQAQVNALLLKLQKAQ